MIKIKVDYRLGGKEITHSYIEEWDRDDGYFNYCPSCGSKGTMWGQMDGDIYAGELNMCSSCGSSFHSTGMLIPNVTPQHSQYFEAISKKDSSRSESEQAE